MARLAFGLAGAALGSFVGQPSLGWTIGSFLGGALFPEQLPTVNQQGPRLNDLNVQSSAYGGAIPWVRGTVRLAGNVIWSEPLTEVATTETQEQGGKGGGPSQTVTTTTYQYYATFAVAYCEGEVAGIKRLWINGELVWDQGTDAAVSEQILSSEEWGGRFRVYLGTETQTVDSAIETHEGVGASSAYRGVVYVVFDSLDVTRTHTLPIVEAEIVQNGTSGSVRGDYAYEATMSAALYTVDCDVVHVGPTGELWVVDMRYNHPWANPARLAVFDLATETWTGFVSLPTSRPVPHGSSTGSGHNERFWFHEPWNVVQVTCRGGGKDADSVVYDATSRQQLGLYTDSADFNTRFTYGGLPIAFDHARNRALTVGYAYKWAIWQLNDAHVPLSELYFQDDSAYAPLGAAVCDTNGDFWALADSSPVDSMLHFVRENSYIPIATVFDADGYLISGGGRNQFIYDPSRHCIYYWSSDGTKLKKFDCATKTMTTVGTYSIAAQEPGAQWMRYDVDLDRIFVLNPIGAGASGGMWWINPADGSETQEILFGGYGGYEFVSETFAYISGVGLWASGGTDSLGRIDEMLFNGLAESPTYLSDVRADLYAEVGLATAQLDNTSISGVTVRGYTVPRVGTARAAEEPLMQRYFYDVVESNGTLKAVLRGAATAYAFEQDELVTDR